jgi:simple sugar transport system ATP-binding protein
MTAAAMAETPNAAGAVDHQPPRLEVLSVSKWFGAFQALDTVSLRVEPGSVHALLGENGAGKSTLVKCILGYHRPDGGRMRLAGRDISPRNPREAHGLGIGMVYQHFTLVPNMTVAENLVVARSRLPFVLGWTKEEGDLRAFLDRMPFRVDLRAPVRSLSAGEKQKAEILKQLYLRNRIVILDEPTSVLTPSEADEVLQVLHAMARGGQVSLVLITHKFREVLRYADEVTVLRRGRVVGHGQVGDLTPNAMAEMMMGEARPATSPEGSAASGPAVDSPAIPPPGEPRLRVVDLAANDDAGLPALRGVGFEVRAGEIVGVAAIAGNGQEELVEVLAGQRPRQGGRVEVAGTSFTPTRESLRARRVRCLPEMPLHNACVAAMSVAENMAFRAFDQPPAARFGWLLSARGIGQAARRLADEYGVRAPSIHSPIGKLSGGNVQRSVLARELHGEVDVLIAANPCMGLDFAAVAEIHARIRRARDQGAAVLLVSADLDEILALAGRILVMSEGRIVHEAAAAGAEPALLGRYMAGHA